MIKVKSLASFAETGVMIAASFHSWITTERGRPGVFTTRQTVLNGAKRRKRPMVTMLQKRLHGRFAFQMELGASSLLSSTKPRTILAL